MTINPTDVRANGSSLRGYMAIFRGAQVLSATINSDAAALSATSLSITILTGAIADVQRGYIVQFYSSIGEFKGQSHVRWGGTLDATHLPVREFSQSEYLIKALDIVRVYALMAFEDKLVESTDTFDPDGVPVGTYNSAPPPLTASGGYDAGFVDGYGTGTPLSYRTQTTNGAPSLILDPTSTPGNLAHLWTLPIGVSFAPGSASTDVSPTLRVTVGEYTVYHDVTDNDNSQTWRQCVTYQCFNAANPPIACVMESAPTGDPAQGWSCTFRAVNFLTLDDAPDGSLCLFFVRQRINGTWQSLGGTSGRSAVKLLGYLSHDESELTPQLQFQRFEVISPLARLSQLPGFSKVMFQNATPDDWSKVSTALTTLRAMIQLIRIYTFALDGGHDLLTGTYLLDVPYPELWLQKESPRQQVDELADGVDARFTCTRSGLFRFDPVVALLDLAYRAVSDVAYTFQRQDVARLVARRNHFDTVETLELHATSGTNSGDTDDALPYFSRAPGSPGHGADFITIERIIATASSSQDDTNARAGRRYAQRNGVFTSSNTGLKGRAPEIDVELRAVYDFLDFDDQIVHFGSFPNPRDIDLTFFDWTLARVRLDYSSGKVISTFQALTDSPPGASYFPPSESVVVPPPPPIIYPIATPTTLPPHNGALPTAGFCLSYSEGAAALITGVGGGSLTFDPWTTGITGTKFYDGCSNPFAYRESGGLSTAGWEYCTDVPNKGAFSLIQTNAALFGGGKIGHRVRATINRTGCLLALSGTNALARTDNLFASLTQVSINGAALDPSASDGANNFGDICPVERTAGVWYALAPYPADATHSALYKSTNYGASWTLAYSYDGAPVDGFYGDSGRQWLEIPYTRLGGAPNIDDASLEIWLYFGSASGLNALFVSSNGGASYIGTPALAAQQGGSPLGQHPTSSFTYGNGSGYFLDGGSIRGTYNGFSSITGNLATLGNAGFCALNGWSPNPLPFIGWTKQNASQGVTVSTDGTTTANGSPAGWAGGIGYAEFSLYTILG